jgi:hypothetical protein
MRALLVVLAAILGGCGTEHIILRGPPERPFDALVVPGCPSQEDGTLSRCQLGRALWAAIVYERGWARYIITSGAAVHSPYVEAEAIAAAVAALGVPADKILLEPNALHTDENMYNSLQIAHALGLRRVAVASNRDHAMWGCRMMMDWKQKCSALPLDFGALAERHRSAGPAIDGLRTARVPDFVPLAERERRIVQLTGRHRPPSFLLYPHFGYLRLNGEMWIPWAPRRARVITWADHLTGRR